MRVFALLIAIAMLPTCLLSAEPAYSSALKTIDDKVFNLNLDLLKYQLSLVNTKDNSSACASYIADYSAKLSIKNLIALSKLREGMRDPADQRLATNALSDAGAEQIRSIAAADQLFLKANEPMCRSNQAYLYRRADLEALASEEIKILGAAPK